MSPDTVAAAIALCMCTSAGNFRQVMRGGGEIEMKCNTNNYAQHIDNKWRRRPMESQFNAIVVGQKQIDNDDTFTVTVENGPLPYVGFVGPSYQIQPNGEENAEDSVWVTAGRSLIGKHLGHPKPQTIGKHKDIQNDLTAPSKFPVTIRMRCQSSAESKEVHMLQIQIGDTDWTDVHAIGGRGPWRPAVGIEDNATIVSSMTVVPAAAELTRAAAAELKHLIKDVRHVATKLKHWVQQVSAIFVQETEKRIHIAVKLDGSNKETTLLASPDDTASSVLIAALSAMDISAKHSLIFERKTVTLEMTLRDIGITDGSTLFLTPNVRGQI